MGTFVDRIVAYDSIFHPLQFNTDKKGVKYINSLPQNDISSWWYSAVSESAKFLGFPKTMTKKKPESWQVDILKINRDKNILKRLKSKSK